MVRLKRKRRLRMGMKGKSKFWAFFPNLSRTVNRHTDANEGISGARRKGRLAPLVSSVIDGMAPLHKVPSKSHLKPLAMCFGWHLDTLQCYSTSGWADSLPRFSSGHSTKTCYAYLLGSQRLIAVLCWPTLAVTVAKLNYWLLIIDLH